MPVTTGTELTANFARELKPAIIEGRSYGTGNISLRMTYHEAKILRDGLNIVLDELEDTVFAREPQP